MADDTGKPGRELTGRKVFLIVAGAFAVIIGVNLFMAAQAVSTFPGLEVKNTYVASQEFNAARAAQEALGWQVSAAIEGEELRLDILDPDGAPVKVASLSGTMGRATHERDDFVTEFERSALGAYLAPVGKLAGGNWNLRMTATAADGTLFQRRIVIYVKGR